MLVSKLQSVLKYIFFLKNQFYISKMIASVNYLILSSEKYSFDHQNVFIFIHKPHPFPTMFYNLNEKLKLNKNKKFLYTKLLLYMSTENSPNSMIKLLFDCQFVRLGFTFFMVVNQKIAKTN